MNTCNDIHSLIDIVSYGGGVSLFPMNMVKDSISSGNMNQVFDKSPQPIELQVAIRSTETDPIVQQIYSDIDYTLFLQEQLNEASSI